MASILFSTQVSNGAECIMFSKRFFMQHANEQVKKVVRHHAYRYPSEPALQENLQRKVDWELYKRKLIRDVIKNKRTNTMATIWEKCLLLAVLDIKSSTTTAIPIQCKHVVHRHSYCMLYYSLCKSYAYLEYKVAALDSYGIHFQNQIINKVNFWSATKFVRLVWRFCYRTKYINI